MQADQTVISLRPGGGNRGGGSRVFGSRFDTSSTNSDLSGFRPHGGSSSLPSFKVESFFQIYGSFCFVDLLFLDVL